MSNIIPTKQELENKLQIRLGSRINVVTKEAIYFRVFGIDMMLPKGMTSDGASLPGFLLPFIDRFDERILFWALVHDYIYKTQFMPRLIADAVFKEGLKTTAGWFIPRLFYATLRIFGWRAWRRQQKRGLEKYPEVKDKLRQHLIKLYEI